MTIPGQIPPAYRRVGVPQGTTVRVRARRNAPPPSLIVEDADGHDLLKFTVTSDGHLDAEYDDDRLTEAARRLLVEVRQLLDLSTADAHIRVAADPLPPRSRP